MKRWNDKYIKKSSEEYKELRPFLNFQLLPECLQNIHKGETMGKNQNKHFSAYSVPFFLELAKEKKRIKYLTIIV